MSDERAPDRPTRRRSRRPDARAGPQRRGARRHALHGARRTAIRERLDGPLRVAIAGRVKAGKSTLLNALVGERLAPTDAGECTRIVTWYRKGTGYEVRARAADGGEQDARRSRAATARSTSSSASSTERDVALARRPLAGLDARQVTLIDTPGLGVAQRRELAPHARVPRARRRASPSDADAVIYLMRHLHRRDVEFLDAFMDRSVTAASPVNAVAVLSRADEIGAGRLDAMDSAAPHRRALPQRPAGPRGCARRSCRWPACSPRPG